MRKDDLKVTLGGLIFLETLSGYQERQNTLEGTNEFMQEGLDMHNAMTNVANVVNDKKIQL